MADRAPLYRPVASHLPPVYQEDVTSWEQLTGFLEPLDALLRAYVAQLEDLTTWLSPGAAAVQPPGLAPSGAAAERQLALLAELASWFGFAFPESWRVPGDPLAEIERRTDFVRRAARLWRRRATPQGFVDWLSFAFGLDDPAGRPILIEHFKYRPSGDTSGTTAADDDPYALRLTLLVPRTAAFADYRRRREVVEFVERWAPAHLLTAVCWVRPDAGWDPTDLAEMRSVIESLVGFTPEEDGIHLDADDVDPTPPNRLGTGLLPGPGVAPGD